MVTSLILAAALVSSQASTNIEQQKAAPYTCAAAAKILGLSDSIVNQYLESTKVSVLSKMKEKDDNKATVTTIYLYGYETGRITTLMQQNVATENDVKDMLFKQCDWEV
jgi:hypothetical protein